MSSFFRFSKKIILIMLAMGGILTDQFSVKRILFLTLLGVIYILFKWLAEETTALISVLIFLSVFVCRYLFLFFSFIKNGIADRFKRKFGESNGFEIYRLLTALMFFLSGSSFSMMIYKSGIEIPHYAGYEEFFVTAGIAAVLTGIIVNVWSALIVGIDVYYYKDLFLGRTIVDFKRKGPYAILSNPMYGVGQANGYGYALIYGSAAGVIFILLNQLLMYIFYFTIEKPHIRKLFANNRKYSFPGSIMVPEMIKRNTYE